MRLIIGNFLFWCLIYIQVLIFYEIQKNGCSFRNGIYGIIFSVYLLIESGILPPLMMLIFECLTLNNIRQSKRKTRSLTVADVVRPGQYTRMSRKDLQFSKMLFNQICLWIILNIPNPCYLLYRIITINDTKASLRLTVELMYKNPNDGNDVDLLSITGVKQKMNLYVTSLIYIVFTREELLQIDAIKIKFNDGYKLI
ncbi:unnamed protein product [Rotaria sordida]|uniref:Uncharacterized protein n=1 Tax=Rotaria sordida TaxID=392033 RepID=A0A813VRW2_9BILA|nr:unnamed protein product [Rotaria sordida]